MNANVVIPENMVGYIKPNLQFYDFQDFYNSRIVTVIFKEVAVFYRCRIKENVCNDIFKGKKYIAHSLTNV